MSEKSNEQLLKIMIKACLKAGEKILEIYEQPFSITKKSDGSPVTIADQKAEEIILEQLAKTNIPVLAEEGASIGEIPNLNEKYFCVDPLDGTKEFIKKNGEFTINIALIEKERPTIGVIIVPTQKKGFIGSNKGAFSFEITNNKANSFIPIFTTKTKEMNIVASRSHGSEYLENLCQTLKNYKDISVGSSLKFCMLAQGKALLYPRFTPTCEWDTAAGQAILEASGGVVLTLDGLPLKYNKSKNNYFNPFFVACANEQLGKDIAKKMAAICDYNI